MAVEVVEVIAPGPQGPPGAPGASGGVQSVDGQTGAVTLSGTYERLHTVNVAAYVVGNGIANDAAAYQSAIAAAVAAGRPLYHPGGVTCYLGTTTLSLPSNLVWIGDGYGSLLTSDKVGTFAFAKNQGWATSTPASKIRVRGIRTRRTNALAGNEGPYDCGFTFRRCDNVKVLDCIFESCMTGVGFEASTNFEARNCDGYSNGDIHVRVNWSGSDGPGGPPGVSGRVVDCWSYNAGFALDGTTTVPEPAGPVGNGFICTQNDVKWLGGGVVNPRYNAWESGNACSGIVIDGMVCHVDISGRSANILVANITNTVIRNVHFELHNGGQGRINISGTIGAAGNTVGQQNILVIDPTGVNDHVTTGFEAQLVNVAGSSTAVVDGAKALGMGLTISGTRCTVKNADISGAAKYGIYATTGVIDVLDCDVRNCGTDTTLAASVRAGITMSTLAGSRLEGCSSSDTRVGAARTQTYGYYVNGGTVIWDRNEASNNLTGELLQTSNPVLLSRTTVSGAPETPVFALIKTQVGTPAAPTATEPFRINAPVGDTHGPFNMVIGGASFLGTFDRAMYFGYNVADGGGIGVAGEPSYRFVIESDYDDSTKRLVEPYFEWAKAANTGRSTATGATTNGSATITASGGAFTAADIGSPITGAGIPANTTIMSLLSATSVILSANATATATGVTLTLTPTSQQRRPWFMQLNRVTGQMHSFELRNKGITLTDWDDNATWGSLTSSGLSVTPRPGQACALTLGWVTGGQNFIQIGNGTNGFLLQPSSAGSNNWEFYSGAVKAFQYNGTQFQVSKDLWVGQTAGAGGSLKGWNVAADNQAVMIGNDGANGIQVGAASIWTGIAFLAGAAKVFELQTNKVGFYGTAPIVKRAATADATDLATVIALANAIKADLVAYGLKTA